MNRISQFPDELLLRILSSLPTKDVVSTMVMAASLDVRAKTFIQ